LIIEKMNSAECCSHLYR